MEIDLETLKSGFELFMFWFGTVVAATSVIVKSTPTQKDDAVLAHVVKVLGWLSVSTRKKINKRSTMRRIKNRFRSNNDMLYFELPALRNHQALSLR